MREYNAQNVIVGRAFAATLLAALAARPAAALLVAPKVRLSADPSFNPTPANVIADFTALEATFTGYAAGGYAPTFTGVVNLSNNISGVVANVVPIATGSAIANVITGYWIDDGVNVIVAEAFPGGLTANFAIAGDFLDLGVAIPLGLRQPAA